MNHLGHPRGPFVRGKANTSTVATEMATCSASASRTPARRPPSRAHARACRKHRVEDSNANGATDLLPGPTMTNGTT
jgi:hypothetical protein